MIPIDKERCQTEKPNRQSFMTLGGNHKMIRCENVPTVIATETNADNEGLKGSMTMCDDCLKVAEKQLPKGFFDLVPLINNKTS
jgi:hypothetical protein|tara:strand:+ start:447 stop:698 length:252 start_codon:yes stop_codon:yes gene_type:complete